MTRPIIKVHNAETGEIIEREFNDEEYAQYLIDKKNQELFIETESAKQALLDKLGITADEAKLLLS